MFMPQVSFLLWSILCLWLLFQCFPVKVSLILFVLHDRSINEKKKELRSDRETIKGDINGNKLRSFFRFISTLITGLVDVANIANISSI